MLGVLVGVGACRPDQGAATPSPTPQRLSAESQPGPAPDAGPKDGPEPEPDPLAVPDEPVPVAPQSVEAEAEPREVRFGVPLPLGHYTFPDGLRVRFSATHECEYDSTAPCSAFEVVAWFQGREAKAALLWGKAVRVAGHSVLLTEDQSLVVRK